MEMQIKITLIIIVNILMRKLGRLYGFINEW